MVSSCSAFEAKSDGGKAAAGGGALGAALDTRAKAKADAAEAERQRQQQERNDYANHENVAPLVSEHLRQRYAEGKISKKEMWESQHLADVKWVENAIIETKKKEKAEREQAAAELSVKYNRKLEAWDVAKYKANNVEEWVLIDDLIAKLRPAWQCLVTAAGIPSFPEEAWISAMYEYDNNGRYRFPEFNNHRNFWEFWIHSKYRLFSNLVAGDGPTYFAPYRVLCESLGKNPEEINWNDWTFNTFETIHNDFNSRMGIIINCKLLKEYLQKKYPKYQEKGRIAVDFCLKGVKNNTSVQNKY